MLLLYFSLFTSQEWKRVDPDTKWKADPKVGAVYGKNYPNDRCKALAILCKFDNPQRCTSHGWRKKLCSKMMNQGQKAGLGPKAVTAVSRHRNYSTLEAYERIDCNTIDTIIKLGQDTSDIVRPNVLPPTKTTAITATIPRMVQDQDIHRPRPPPRVSFGGTSTHQDYGSNQSFESSSSYRPRAVQRTGSRSMSPTRQGMFYHVTVII
jgi:hypothetical protein